MSNKNGVDQAERIRPKAQYSNTNTTSHAHEYPAYTASSDSQTA